MKVDDLIAGGADRAEIEALPVIRFTPEMAEDAYHGLAGRIVRTIEPHSEADPVAILMHLLVGVGNVVGRTPHALVEKTPHTCAEFIAVVGDSAKGRKGQAWSTPRDLLSRVDTAWSTTRVKSGLSSGEGLIYNVRDRVERHDPKSGDIEVVEEGEPDKRLLIVEPELATVLRRMQGETNSLSAVLREAWESGSLSTLTKNSPLRSTGAHISVIAHTTREELVRSLTETDRANGFANRFIFILVRRSKCLPDPVPISDALLEPLVAELHQVIAAARHHQVIVRNDQARAIWSAVYPKLSEGEPGLVGAVLARAEAHVLRLSLIYAVLDRSLVVRPEHLRAALAVWDYADASARRIFGAALGLSVADIILATLRAQGPRTREEITHLFQRNKAAAEIDAALRFLREKGQVHSSSRPPEGGKGRPATIWEASP
jgi:hypothetical protein